MQRGSQSWDHLAIFVFEIKRFHWPLHCPRVKMLGLRGQDSLKVWPIDQGEPKQRCNNLKTVHIWNRCMLDDDLKAHYFGNNLSFVTSRCYSCDLSTFKVGDFKFDRKYFKSFWEFFVKEKLWLKIKLPSQPLYQDRALSFCCQSDLKSACFKVVSCPTRLSSRLLSFHNSGTIFPI